MLLLLLPTINQQRITSAAVNDSCRVFINYVGVVVAVALHSCHAVVVAVAVVVR